VVVGVEDEEEGTMSVIGEGEEVSISEGVSEEDGKDMKYSQS
jgi:hypothetical protein